MTSTFTLTGRILDKSKEPVARARLVLASNTAVLRDNAADEVYAYPPRITTDDEGYLCVADGDGNPAQTPGVPLVVGVQYKLRGVNQQLLGGTLVFTAPAAGQTLNIADVITEPPASDPSWSDALGTLQIRVTTLEQGGGAGGGGPVAWADITGKPAIPDSPDDIGAAALSHTHTSAQITDFAEAVQDAVAALLAQGTGVTLSYNDAGNTLTITSTGSGGGGLDAEAVRDAIGVALIGSGLISVAVNDAADTITISTTATQNSTDAALRDRSTHTGTQPVSTVTGALAAANNLSDLANVAAAKANLGLGSVMVTSNSDGTQTVTVDDGGVFTLVDNGNGTATLTLVGTATTLGPGPSGRGVTSIARTSGTGAAGTTDTYTITYSDSTTSTFTVVNGTNGTNGSNGTNGRGVTSIARTSGTGAPGTTDTYTITYSDATTSTFNVYNGADGSAGGGLSLTVQDEGSSLATSATTLNFVGSGVTATGTGATKTITIPGGGGSSSLTVQDEGSSLTTAADTVNFVGAGVFATGSTATKTVTVPGNELPDTAIAATFPRWAATTTSAIGTSGQIKGSLIRVVAGQPVNAIRLVSGSTAGAGLTHAIAAFYDPTQSGPVQLATSADDTTNTAWAANTARTYTMQTPYQVTTTGWYYVAFMIAGTTLPSLYLQSALSGTGLNALPPMAAWTTSTTYTTTLPATIVSFSVNAQRFYAEIL